MKKLTTASIIGLAIILFSLIGATYYVSKNYVPPPPALTDSLSMLRDSTLFTTDSTFATNAAVVDSTRQKAIDSAAIAQNMLVTNVLNDSLAKVSQSTSTTPDVIEIAPTVKEVVIETPPQSVSTKSTVVASKGVETGKYYVVVGTFTQEVNAKDEIKTKAGDRTLTIFKDGKYYRLIAGEFSTAKPAKQLSNELTNDGISNFVIHK